MKKDMKRPRSGARRRFQLVKLEERIAPKNGKGFEFKRTFTCGF